MAYHDRGTKEELLIVPPKGARRLDAVLMAPDYMKGSCTSNRGEWYTDQKAICPRPPMLQRLHNTRPRDVEFGD